MGSGVVGPRDESWELAFRYSCKLLVQLELITQLAHGDIMYMRTQRHVHVHAHVPVHVHVHVLLVPVPVRCSTQRRCGSLTGVTHCIVCNAR